MNIPDISCKIQIQKPIEVVFDAVANHRLISQYFISNSSAEFKEGETVQWTFPEFPESFPVKIIRVQKPAFFQFEWENQGKPFVVTIEFREVSKDDVLVTVTESGKAEGEEGLKWLAGNSMGWGNFLACLKAFVEHGINLRRGAFSYMKN